MFSHSFVPSSLFSLSFAIDDLIEHLKDHNKRLKKLLETEKRNTRAVRNAHLRTLAQQTELQQLLQDAMHDVKKEMGHAQAADVCGRLYLSPLK